VVAPVPLPSLTQCVCTPPLPITIALNGVLFTATTLPSPTGSLLSGPSKREPPPPGTIHPSLPSLSLSRHKPSSRRAPPPSLGSYTSSRALVSLKASSQCHPLPGHRRRAPRAIATAPSCSSGFLTTSSCGAWWTELPIIVHGSWTGSMSFPFQNNSKNLLFWEICK
jgi:hypothetical protein